MRAGRTGRERESLIETAQPYPADYRETVEQAGKTVVPFITHGGCGTGSSLAVLRQLAPAARVTNAFVMQADQERDTLERVTQWLQRRPA